MRLQLIREGLAAAGITTKQMEEGPTALILDGKTILITMEDETVTVTEKGLFSRKHRFSRREFEE